MIHNHKNKRYFLWFPSPGYILRFLLFLQGTVAKKCLSFLLLPLVHSQNFLLSYGKSKENKEALAA